MGISGYILYLNIVMDDICWRVFLCSVNNQNCHDVKISRAGKVKKNGILHINAIKNNL